MSQQEERPRPFYGYVVAAMPVPNKPGVILWKVRVQSPGEYFERRVTIEHNSVPKGICVGMDVFFNLTTVGSKATLVAINVEAYIRQGSQEERIEQ